MTSPDHDGRDILGSHQQLKRCRGRQGRAKACAWAFLAVCAVLALWYAIAFVHAHTPSPQLNADSCKAVTLTHFAPGTADRLEIRLAGESPYALLRGGEGKAYTVEGQAHFSLDQAVASAMFRRACEIRAEKISDRPSGLSDYGLDAPRFTLIVTADRAEVLLRVGNAIPTQPSFYAMREGDGALYAVDRALVSSLTRKLNALHTLNMPERLSDEDIRTLRIAMRQGETLELSRAQAKSDIFSAAFAMLQPFPYPAHTYRVDGDILPALARLAPAAYACHLQDPSDMKAYGLDVPWAQVCATDANGGKIDLSFGDVCGGMRYMTMDDTGDVYLINIEALRFLDFAKSAYLAEQFVNLIPIESVDSVTVTQPDGALRLDIKDGGQRCTLNDRALDRETGRQIYEQIISPQHDAACADLAFSGEVFATVRFSLCDGREFTVEYLSYDADYLAIKRRGISPFLIKRSKILGMLQEISARIPAG